MLPPGGEGEVKVTLTPKNNQEDIVKQIVVVTNDPNQPRFTLTMKGKLLVELRATPANLSFGDLRIGADATVEFGLSIRDPEATRLESVSVEDQANYQLRPLGPGPEGQLRYELRFRGSETIGKFGSRVEVRTNGPELNIPIRATVVSNLRYASRIQFVDKDGVFAPRQLRISTRDGVAPTITKIEDPAGLLTLERIEGEGKGEGKVLVIDARLDPAKFAALDEAQRRKQHTLTLHTNDPDEPRAEIIYSIRTPAIQARVAR